MSNTKTYHSSELSKGDSLMIYWERDKYITKSHQELTVSFNGINHSHDINGLKMYTVKSIADSYMRNITFTHTWIHNQKFIEILVPIIEEFQKDVEYEYSFDGWIGRIFIEPFENFVDWLKK